LPPSHPALLHPRCRIVDRAFVFFSLSLRLMHQQLWTVRSLYLGFLSPFLAVDFLHIAFLRSPNPLSCTSWAHKPRSKPPKLLFLKFTCIPRLPLRIPHLSIDKKFRFPMDASTSPPAAQPPSCGLVSSAHVHSFISLFRRVYQTEMSIPNSNTRHLTETVVLERSGVDWP